MKLLSTRLRDQALYCAAIVILYLAVFQIVQQTHVAERLMTLNFGLGEVWLLAAFVVLRLATYFVVPSLLLGLAAWKWAKYLCRTDVKN